MNSGESEGTAALDLGPYTGCARAAVETAKLHAQALGHPEVTADHLLLALLTARLGGMTGSILHHLQVPETMRQQVQDRLGHGDRPDDEPVEFSAQIHTTLDLAQRESDNDDRRRVGTEHLLLGLLEVGGAPAQTLAGHGVTRDQVLPLVGQLRSGTCYGCLEDGYDPGLPEGFEFILPKEIRDLDYQIAQVRRQMEAAIDAQDFEIAGSLRDHRVSLSRRRETVLREKAADIDVIAAVEEIERLRQLVNKLRSQTHQTRH